MEKEKKITAPDGCEIEKVELVDGVAVVTFREKKRKLPKTWEEFCEMYNVTKKEYYIDDFSRVLKRTEVIDCRDSEEDKNMLPDRATAEAVLALCQLIQLRNAYNGDWVPDWTDDNETKFVIRFLNNEIYKTIGYESPTPLCFKTKELRDQFLENFGDLIEKSKPLYGIKEGGEKL